MVDFIFQENSTENINVSQSQITYKNNTCSNVKFHVGITGTISLDQTAQYLDESGNVIIEGKIKVLKEIVKDLNSERRIYEVQLFDYGYNLIDGVVNNVYRSLTVEGIIEAVVEANGLTFVNDLPTASGITIAKRVYRDLRPVEVVNDLCETLGASWRVAGTEFHLYRQGDYACTNVINESEGWKNKEGWKDDTNKKATKVIVVGANIMQRTSETLTGTGTEFYTSWIPENIKISGLVQTTSNIAGDFTVDAQNKKITFNTSKTNPVVEYSYKSQVRAEVGEGSIIKTLKKSYIETFSEARKLGRKYLELYKDGIQNAVWQSNDIYGLDVRDLKCGYKINVTNRNNTPRNGQYIISQVVRKYPQGTEVTVGEDETSIFDWQVESKDRIKQLESQDNNSEFIQLDVPKSGKVKVNISGELTKLTIVENTGDILWASDDTLSNNADLIGEYGDGTITNAVYSSDAAVGNYSMSFDGTGDTVVIADGNNFDVDTIAVSFWIKTTASRQEDIIRKWESGSNQRSWAIYTNAQYKVVFQVSKDGSLSTSAVSTAAINDGNWHHVVCTFDGANIKVYVDNSAGTPVAYAFNLYHSTSNIKLGDSFMTANDLTGKLDEIRIYDGLTAGEITTLFGKGDVDDGMIAHWSFEEGSGATAYNMLFPNAYDDSALPADAVTDLLA